jgi:hypothetical protein
VAQDHEGGTCGEGGSLVAEAEPQGPAGVDSGSHVDEGENVWRRFGSKEPLVRDESQERKVGTTDPGEAGALNGSQGHGGRLW